MQSDSSIAVIGCRSVTRHALERRLQRAGLEYRILEISEAGDPLEPSVVEVFLREMPADCIFLTGARSGGIQENIKHPAQLMLSNLLTDSNVIRAAHSLGVPKLCYVASSCVYPKHGPQPLRVEYLFSGPLEETNAAYATSKLSALVLCRAYRQEYGDRFFAAIPANPFGPEDDFGESSHVIPAMIRKLHEAKTKRQPEVRFWGSGNAKREFIAADDLADALIMLMLRYDGEGPLNLGSGWVVSIRELAETLSRVIGFDGKMIFDVNYPDGMPEKTLESSEIRQMGWAPSSTFRESLEHTYSWYLEKQARNEIKAL